MKTLTLYNSYHLGDCIYSVLFMKKELQNNKVKFIFYCKDEYHKELQYYIDKDRIELKSLSLKPPTAIDTWINQDNLFYNYINNRYIVDNASRCWDLFYITFFRSLESKLKLNKTFFTVYDFIFDTPLLLKDNELTKLYPSIDWLIINSQGLSAQVDNEKVNIYINKLIEDGTISGNIISTAPLAPDIPCTLDYNLNLIDIGNLAITSSNVIGVLTSPFIFTVNKWNINTTMFYILHDYGLRFSYDNFKNLNYK